MDKPVTLLPKEKLVGLQIQFERFMASKDLLHQLQSDLSPMKRCDPECLGW